MYLSNCIILFHVILALEIGNAFAMVSRPTITDLAKKAGVSVATVDRVLNRRLPVREDTAILVVQAAEAIGYHATGLLKRRLTETPKRKFAFLLQKPDAFYQSLGKELSAATKANHAIDGKPVVEFIEDITPTVIADRIRLIGPKVNALAVVAVDHPLVNEAVDQLVQHGTPVFTLLSELSTTARTGHVGLDGRKVGRTAAWTISRTAKNIGKIGILVGSHRYLNQELAEISFRSYMREHAPQFTLLEPIVNLDDDQIAYEAIRDMVIKNRDLVGIYVTGGGQEGLITALRESGRAQDIIAVCNELTATTRSALIDGTVDLILSHPTIIMADRLVKMMIKACNASEPRHLPPLLFPADIHISENI